MRAAVPARRAVRSPAGLSSASGWCAVDGDSLDQHSTPDTPVCGKSLRFREPAHQSVDSIFSIKTRRDKPIYLRLLASPRVEGEHTMPRTRCRHCHLPVARGEGHSPSFQGHAQHLSGKGTGGGRPICPIQLYFPSSFIADWQQSRLA